MKKLSAILCAIVCLPTGITAFATQPHLQRSGANLITNPNIKLKTGWILGGSAAYDASVSKDAGSGSLKMTIAYPSANYSYVESALIPVTPGKVYTTAFYMRSDIFPPPVPSLYVTYYNSSQQYIRNIITAYQGVTDSNSWQECVCMIRPQPGEVYVKIKNYFEFQPIGYTGTVWSDNFYMGEGIGFEQPPTAKPPFNGTQTKVDALGNVEILKSGKWMSFFPIMIYTDWGRSDWTIYSKQGFNTNAWAQDYTAIQRGKDAGLMSGFDVSGFTNLGMASYNNTTLLTSRLNDVKNNNLMDSMLWYYRDNENCYADWDIPLSIFNMIKAFDVDANDNRLHPIYQLQGNEGLARKYNNSNVNIMDIVGDYVTPDASFAGADNRGALGLVILDNIEQQRAPVVIAQINHGVGLLFRARVFTSIAKGAKGIGFWKDGGSTIPIEQQPWWDDLPNIATEINQMLPIIRMPHWTSWSLSSNNSLIDFGTRDYQNQGYVIVTNEQDSAQNVTFTISGLPYTATAARNFFTSEIESQIDDDMIFSATIPAYGSKVYVLENIPEVYTSPSSITKLSVNSKYDLIVNKVWWDAPPVAGQPFSVKFQISNIGTVKTAAGAGVQRAKVYLNNVKIATVKYDDIAPKSTVTLTAEIPDTSIVGGKQTKVLVWADATDKVAEIRETNNTTSVSFLIETRPDLTVKEITLSPKPAAKKPLTIYFKINNIGASATTTGAGVQIATVFVDGKSVGTVACDDVPKGGSIARQLVLPGGIATAGVHKIKVYADTNNAVGEISEINNALEKSFSIAK